MDPSNQPSKRPTIKHIVSVNEHGVFFLDGQRVVKGAKGLFVCPICGHRSQSAKFFEKHVQNVHNGAKIFKCKLCLRSYDIRSSLDFHVRSIHERNLRECAECGKRFSTKSGLVSHMVRHGEKLTKCRHCSKLFINKSAVIEHIRNIHLRTRFHCSRGDCTIRFLTEAERQAHINVVHEGLRKGYKCELCWMSFLMKEPLQCHYATVHPNSLECQICPWPETFSRSDEAADHLRERHHWYTEKDDEWVLKMAMENAPENPYAPWVKNSTELPVLIRLGLTT